MPPNLPGKERLGDIGCHGEVLRDKEAGASHPPV